MFLIFIYAVKFSEISIACPRPMDISTAVTTGAVTAFTSDVCRLPLYCNSLTQMIDLNEYLIVDRRIYYLLKHSRWK